eukprot:CAMPEP_0197439866 /NCGR_PEP_ID=MMETSP1175-20131217/6516_1 /TAXON_ID=1003142 /ORGANISM="Triceratium dubium, Strain CCMP147" /LENGTH=352 /DNA_ID=CAMNT_0042969863 /DNA_START=53 /DNA_END=1111 /DNA_ORIENTATION=-
MTLSRVRLPNISGIFTRRSSAAVTAEDTSFASAPSPRNSSDKTRSNEVDTPHSRPSAYVSGPVTHFGYADVSVSEKETKVREVFESVAESYDVMNDLMSAGLHRLWKDELIAMTGISAMANAVRRRAGTSRTIMDDRPLLSILDVAGGTGDVAFRFVDAAGCPERALSSGRDEISVTVCDINKEMLKVGEQRARGRYGDGTLLVGNDKDSTQALQFVQGNAQCLPFADDSFDIYTIAFGLRNVTDVDMALRDAVRVLKPGGRFLCLEFSKLPNPLLSALYDSYSFNVIPTIGEIVTHDRGSYQYLVESIRKFCDQGELKKRMETAGFANVTYTNMTGGVVAVHSGWKPLSTA